MTNPTTKAHYVIVNIYNPDDFSIKAMIVVPDDRDEEEYISEVLSKFEKVSYIDWDYT
jgi:hypothetical protein